MNNELPNNTIKYRIEQLEKSVERTSNDIEIIMRNHLPHIQTAIEKLKQSIEEHKISSERQQKANKANIEIKMYVLTSVNVLALLVYYFVTQGG